MRSAQKTLVVLLGPTASGKTGLAIKLAQVFQTEIISADSRQFYREIPIGTAAPSDAETKTIQHYFVGHLSIEEAYNVSSFEKDVLQLLEQKFTQRDTMIMTGGSGLYINAVCNGIDDLPDPDNNLRQEMNELYDTEGISALQDKLKVLDPDYYEQVDLNNSKRLMRAIEVCIQTGKKYSDLRLKTNKPRNFNILKIGLEIPRQELNQQIHERTDVMLKSGWLEEAKKVIAYRKLNALNTVGYKELFKYLDGDWSLEQAIEKIKTNTRRYAKRQMTWFRKDDEINWFSPADLEEIKSFIRNRITPAV